MKAYKLTFILLLCVALNVGLPVRATGAPVAWTAAVDYCPPLSPPGGVIVNVDTVGELENAVNSAVSGTTILIADGTYNLNGVYLLIDVSNVTLRSASGNREAVVLDGNYITTEIMQVTASNVTIADLTLREAYDHPIHVMSRSTSHTLNTLIYNVHIIDPGQQAVKINPYTSSGAQYFPDSGVVACSRIELTDSGRTHIRDNCYTGGVDAHQAKGWTIRDNHIEGFWCSSGLSEHAIHMWVTCRDTLVERNVLKNNARGVGFGMLESGSGRTYADNPCPSAGGGYVDHYGGIIRNNFIFANRSQLFSSGAGFDCGICLWQACGARVLHNTVASTQNPFSSIEWRFDHTDVEILNNLVTYNLRDRGGTEYQHGNLTDQPLSLFVNGSGGDLHLASSASAAIDQVTAPADASTDIDGDARPNGSASDVGADEYLGATFTLQADPTWRSIQPGETASFTLSVLPSGGFSSAVALAGASPSPYLDVEVQPASITSPEQATLTITDTHSTPLLPGIHYTIPVTGTSGVLTQVIYVDLLVGDWPIYLPVVLYNSAGR